MPVSPPYWRRPGLWLLSAALLLAVFLRVHQISFPGVLTFDEPHFVENARNYLAGLRDWNDHPPLGKLLIALAMQVCGDNPLGWRLVPLIFGLLTIPFAGALARRLYPQLPIASALAMAFVGLDGFLIAYSRTALLDGMLASIYMATLVLMLAARSYRQWSAVFVMFACACSIKWSGVTLLLPLALLVFFKRAPFRQLCATLWLLPVTYFMLYALGLWLTHQPASLLDLWQVNHKLFVQHMGATAMTHPATSYWYTWLYMENPIVLRYDHLANGHVAVMSTMGNPLLWVGVTTVMLITAGVLFYRWRELLEVDGSGLISTARADAFLLCAWVAPILPWIISDRDSYIYHYLPAYAVGLVLLAAYGARFMQRWPGFTWAMVVVAFSLSLFFAPIWAQLAISEQAFGQRMWFPGWR